MPTYNHSDFILRAIDSVKMQSYRPIELVIINDHSTDNTDSILDTYDFWDIVVKRINNLENLGIGPSRNEWIKISNWAFIAFLDSDDEWIDRDKLTMQINFLTNNQDYWFVSTGWLIENNGEVKKECYFKSNSDFQNLALKYYLAHTSTWVIRSEIVKKVWLFWKKKSEDSEYLLRVWKNTKCFCIDRFCSCNHHLVKSEVNSHKISYFLFWLYICFLNRKSYPHFLSSMFDRIKRWFIFALKSIF